MFYGKARSKGRPINVHTKPKRLEQMYEESIQQAVFMKKPGESIADVISRVFKIYAARSEESECYKLWQEQYSKVKSLEEEMAKKEKRIAELEKENGTLKQLINDYMASQITTKAPGLDGSGI